MNAPDWLSQHGGDLKLGSDSTTWYVLLAGEPHYSVSAVPLNGKFGSRVKLTVSGQRIGGASVYGTANDAIHGGLEELRKTLGW